MRTTATIVAFATAALVSACANYDGHYYTPPRNSDTSDPINNPRRGTTRVTPEAVRLFERARREYVRGDVEDAWVTLEQVLLRDRFHLDANELLQDITLARGQHPYTNERYFKFYGDHPDSAIALYLYLRPVLLKRESIKPVRDKLDDARRAKVQEIVAEAERLRSLPDEDGWTSYRAARNKAAEAWDYSPLDVQSRIVLRQAFMMRFGDTMSFWREEYQKLIDENETNGDLRFLYELYADSHQESAQRYAADIALDLPGLWLYYGLAQLCLNWIDDLQDDADAPASSRSALLRLTHLLLSLCEKADPDWPEAVMLRANYLYAHGDWANAEKSARRARELAPPGGFVDADAQQLLSRLEAPR